MKSTDRAITNGQVRLSVGRRDDGFHVDKVEWLQGHEWRPLVHGIAEEFSTSQGGKVASACDVDTTGPAPRVRLTARTSGWEAEETIQIDPERPLVVRTQRWRFLRDWEGAVHPGWELRLADHPGLRYTLPLKVHDAPVEALAHYRPDVAYALPFPFHVWHDGRSVVLAGVLRDRSPGTLDLIGNYQIDEPGKPWDGGIVHASEQHSGLLWGPDKCGQVDTGMATGNSLAAIEYWLAEESTAPRALASTGPVRDALDARL